MEQYNGKQNAESVAAVYMKEGRIYFSKEAERRFYFVLTLIMLVAGILYKIGLL